LRVVVGLLVITFLFNLSTSSYARHEVWKSMNVVPVLNKLFWAFWILTTVTLVMSPDLSASMTKYINNQIFWTMMFPVAALVGRREGMIRRSCTILVLSAILVACVGINEYHMEKVVWIEWLPSWLRADEEILATVMEGQARAGTLGYRVRGPQTVSLYFAENLSMVFPLVVHYTYKAPGFFRTIAMVLACWAMMMSMYLTGARSGMIGIVLTLVIYIFFAALRKRQENPVSIGATATLLAYPAIVAVVTAIILFWKRARNSVLGGGQHQSSNVARDRQWDRGWDLIAQNPFGHGLDRSAEVLNFHLTMLIATLVGGILTLVLIGGLVLLAVAIMTIVCAIIGAIKASKNELFRYPLTIRFVQV
jgi:uncharacterized Tic20 family protein